MSQPRTDYLNDLIGGLRSIPEAVPDPWLFSHSTGGEHENDPLTDEQWAEVVAVRNANHELENQEGPNGHIGFSRSRETLERVTAGLLALAPAEVSFGGPLVEQAALDPQPLPIAPAPQEANQN